MRRTSDIGEIRLLFDNLVVTTSILIFSASLKTGRRSNASHAIRRMRRKKSVALGPGATATR